MESMNLLDITIKYFNVIVFVMCVIFGMTSLFASWIAWREIHRKKNIIRSVLAAYNIAEDTIEKGRTPEGDLELDPTIVQTVFNSLQEILNAIYGEVTGKPIPPAEERSHGSRLRAGVASVTRVWKRKEDTAHPVEEDTPPRPVVVSDRDHRHSVHP